MTAEYSLAEQPFGTGLASPNAPGTNAYFDPVRTLLSQYATDPVTLALLDSFGQWLNASGLFDDWFARVRNIYTAEGYGLDVWGRILGVSRVLNTPAGSFLGFASDPAARPFGFGVFFSGRRLSDNVALTDDAFRTLLLAKAALNITNASIPATNAILLSLFGDGYVRDNGDMTITYVFSRSLSALEQAIVYQSGALPKPTGVSFTVETP